MSKRILLIDSDEAFAKGLQDAMNARGFTAVMATNSEQGMTLARKDNPDLIVVCVEAQPTNGYMLCTRLKKDNALKGIPVILTSANATPDSFEKHKKLKTRAEEYLIKPFEPQVMLQKASELLGVPLPAGAEAQEEEIVSMEDEPLGLGDLVLEDEPIHLTDSEAAAAHGAEGAAVSDESIEVEEIEDVEVEHAGGAQEVHHDDDLQMFDRAFDALGMPGQAESDKAAFGAMQLAPEEQVRVQDDLEATHQRRRAPALHDEVHAHAAHEPADSTDGAIDALGDDLSLEDSTEVDAHPAAPIDHDAHAELEVRVAQLEEELAARTAELEAAKRGSSSSGELLKLKEARTRADKESLRLKEELHARETELVELREQQTTLESQAQALKDEAVKREAAAKALQQRAEALAAAAKKFERELTQAREELKGGAGHRTRASELETELSGARELHETEVAQLREELSSAQEEAAKHAEDATAARDELEKVRTELSALTGEKELLSDERDELRRKIDAALAESARNEERAVKAYQKIKVDERLREKTRKALQVALQLLDENSAPEAILAEKQSA